MNAAPISSAFPASNRARADARLLEAGAAACLVHELEVHQIELELQNEELRFTRTALEEQLEKSQHGAHVLATSEGRFRILERATHDSVWDLDVGTGTIWRSENFSTLFAYPLSEVGTALEWWEARLHPDDRQRVADGLRAALAGRERNWTDEYRFFRSDGSVASIYDRGWIERGTDGKAIRMVGGMTDVTEREQDRKRIETLERAAAMETERLRLARDLHDDLGTSLAYIAVAARELATQTGGNHQGEQLESIRQTAIDLMSSVRDIIWAVSPQSDSLIGLVEHLSAWVHRTLEDAGIACALELPTSVSDRWISGSMRNAIFLATKEAVQNLLKHAGATRAELRIALGADGVFTVGISDNGCGISRLPSSTADGGLGIPSMKARLASVGGTVEVNGAPGGGTVVGIRVPLEVGVP